MNPTLRILPAVVRGGAVHPAPVPTPAPAPASTERLWRELVGEELRESRLARGESLRNVAGRARVSPQYLSEIERGFKEPSSEILAAIGGALERSLLELTSGVAERLRSRAAATGSASATGISATSAAAAPVSARASAAAAAIALTAAAFALAA